MYDEAYLDHLARNDSMGPAPEDEYPYDQAYLDHLAREEAIMRTRERRRCYDCKPYTGAPRRVTDHLTVNPVDPTRGYRLTCGHVTIDV